MAHKRTNLQGKHAKWIKKEDEDGNTYYENEVTGESSWENPEKPKKEDKKSKLLKTENDKLKKQMKKLQADARKEAVKKNKMMTDVNDLRHKIREHKAAYEEYVFAWIFVASYRVVSCRVASNLPFPPRTARRTLNHAQAYC